MRSLLFALLLVCNAAFANVYSVRINASTSNIPTAFSTSAASLVLQGVLRVSGIVIDNRTSTEIAVNCSGNASVAPSSTSNNNIYVANGTIMSLPVATNLNGVCYVQSMGSAITSGIVNIYLIGG